MKYNDEQKIELVNRYRSGESMTAICVETGVPKSTMYGWVQPYSKIAARIDRAPTIQEHNRLKSHIKKLEAMITVLQSSNCCCSSPLQEKLDAIESMHGSYSIHILCDALNVSRGTYYNHILRNKRSNNIYTRKREAFKPIVKEIFDEYRQLFGAGKITSLLKSRGYQISETTVHNIMREMGLHSISPVSKKDYLRWKKGENKNVLRQNFYAAEPNKVWVSDVTYFKNNNSIYYCCVIIDLFSRKVIAHRVSRKNSTLLLTKSFKSAYSTRQPESELLFHSDRGSIYTSYSFRKLLRDHGVTQSLSRPSKPHDNAVGESFFATLKREELYRSKYKSEADLFRSIDDYVEFYNSKRPHTTLQYKTPDQMEEISRNKAIN